MIKWFKSRGFTDRLYIINFIMVWIFVWACFIITLVSNRLNIIDTSVLSNAVTCAFADLGIHTSFIVWKAKVENCEKHKVDNVTINVD